VIIAGVATNVCCDTIAREANARDFRVLFLSDGAATGNDAAQEVTLKTIGSMFGQVLTVAEVMEKIRSGVTEAAHV
jgi:ureidoacrylate peracid hydrolase